MLKYKHNYLKYWRIIRYWVKAKYNLSTPDIEMILFLYKGKRFANTIYRKLNGEEIAESPSINPLFRTDASYMDKIYRNSIKELNEFIQQQRYLSQ